MKALKVSPATTLYVFAAYLVGLALILLFLPNVLLSIFGIPATSEVWIRVVGMVVLEIAIFNIMMARENNTTFYWATIYTRASVVFFFIAFVVGGLAPASLILFGGFDLLGALWTWYTLR